MSEQTQYIVITANPEVSSCQFCTNAKMALQSRGKSYHEVYVDSAEAADITGDLGYDIDTFRTVPIIFDLNHESGSELIGGFTELLKKLNQ